MNIEALETKLLQLDELKSIEKFKNILISLEDSQLEFINPIAFAKEYDFDIEEIINIFLYASRVGIFDISWNLLCPMCGGVLNSYKSIGELRGESYYCSVCDINLDLNLDDYIEVSFTINPEIYVVTTDYFKDWNTFFKRFVSRNFIFEKEVLEMMRGNSLFLKMIDENAISSFDIEFEENTTYRLISYNYHFSINITTKKLKEDTQSIKLIATNDGFNKKTIELTSKKLKLVIENRSSTKIGAILFKIDVPRMQCLLEDNETTMRPFLRGKELLANEVFKKIFKISNLDSDLMLNIRSLTVLFSDLKDSTFLYERIGDVKAFDLIQKHFSVLEEIIKESGGTIIKTMGDAVMATFPEPYLATISAIKMGKAIKDIKIDSEKSLDLKIGIHEGHALIINNNGNIDYFGQSINIASRVQGVAQAGEIVVTKEVFASEDVQRVLKENSLSVSKSNEKLKGIDNRVSLFKLKRRKDGIFQRFFS